jgi:hypothetical protein
LVKLAPYYPTGLSEADFVPIFFELTKFVSDMDIHRLKVVRSEKMCRAFCMVNCVKTGKALIYISTVMLQKPISNKK